MSDAAVTHNLRELGTTLRTYAELSRKTPEDVLAKKGRDLTMFLYRRFREVRQAETPEHRLRILNKARSLKYALGPISSRAAELVTSLIGDNKSAVGKISTDGDQLIIRTVRVGKRGHRITGGRKGRGGRAATLGEFQGDEFERLPGEVVLNRRALTVAFALMLRMRGSGSLAVSWLFRQWRKGLRGAFRLQNVNPKAVVQLQGTADMTGGDEPMLTIVSKMPGVSKFPAALALALRDTADDTRDYIIRKLQENAEKAGFA